MALPSVIRHPSIAASFGAAHVCRGAWVANEESFLAMCSVFRDDQTSCRGALPQRPPVLNLHDHQRRRPTPYAPSCSVLNRAGLSSLALTMEAPFVSVRTVGVPGACCWMRLGLGRGRLLFTLGGGWLLFDRFFHGNHSFCGRFGPRSGPLDPYHALSCRRRAPVASSRVRVSVILSSWTY